MEYGIRKMAARWVNTAESSMIVAEITLHNTYQAAYLKILPNAKINSPLKNPGIQRKLATLLSVLRAYVVARSHCHS